MQSFMLKIISNNIKFNNTVGVIVLILIFLILGFYKLHFNKLEYKSSRGKVTNIKMGYEPCQKTGV